MLLNTSLSFCKSKINPFFTAVSPSFIVKLAELTRAKLTRHPRWVPSRHTILYCTKKACAWLRGNSWYSVGQIPASPVSVLDKTTIWYKKNRNSGPQNTFYKNPPTVDNGHSLHLWKKIMRHPRSEFVINFVSRWTHTFVSDHSCRVSFVHTPTDPHTLTPEFHVVSKSKMVYFVCYW